MATSAASLPQTLFNKAHEVLSAPSLPTSFNEATPRTTPPLSPTLHAAVSSQDEQLLLATQLLDSAHVDTAKDASPVALDGWKLTLGEVVAAARFSRKVRIDDAPAIKARIDESVDFLKSKASQLRCPRDGTPSWKRTLTICGNKQLVNSVYGVTTGFGGVSAFLQSSAQATAADEPCSARRRSQSADTRTQDARALQVSLLEMQLCGVLPGQFDNFALGRGLENSLPLEVVRGAMMIRVNSLSR